MFKSDIKYIKWAYYKLKEVNKVCSILNIVSKDYALELK